jgi:urocanate hydratase
MGVIRHVDAGYDRAVEVAKERGVRIPMLPTDALTSQVPTGSQTSQAQAGSLAGVAPRPGNPVRVAPETR